MAPAVFHVAIEGPAGMSFPSFPSTALGGGDADNITLEMIRTKCNISNKLFFTVDGNSRIADGTKLAYYLSLTAEGQAILHPQSSTTTKHKATGTENHESTDKAAEPGTRTATVRVAERAAKEPVPLPAKNEALAQLLDMISKGGTDKGRLPSFVDRQLAALAANYVVDAGGQTYQEPSEMTEQQWESVLTNNRALHGYWYDIKTGALVKASKQVFRLHSAAQPGKSSAAGSNDYFPPIPPFFVCDDANVSVAEVRGQKQRTWIKEGFNLTAVEASIGESSTVPASIEASFEKEQAWANEVHESKDADSLSVAYNFPRAVIELDPGCLELTEECRRDALNVTDRKARDAFFRKYGTIFATRLTLGGFLHSSRNVTSTERSQLNQEKDKTRIAAGLSILTPWLSGGINVANVNSTSSSEGQASLFQDAWLTWDAHGGNTLLCSNPAAWASTVKDHRLWRLMGQKRIVSLEYLIRDVDIVAWSKLDDPSVVSHQDKNILADDDFCQYVRSVLMSAFLGHGHNAYAQKVTKFYQDGKYDTATKIQEYNDFMKKHFQNETAAIINGGKLFGGLDIDQKIGFGLYMTAKGQLKL